VKTIKVICDCGQEMFKIEDGRQLHTIFFQPGYPYEVMEFACECGKTVDITWREIELEVIEPA